MDAEQYLHGRVDDQIAWYGAKSAWNQRRFKQLRLAEIAFASVIPLITILPLGEVPGKIVVAALGATVAVIAGTISLFRFQENWVEYRAAGEALKREKFMFLTGAGPYEAENRLPVLVRRVEAVLGAEHEKWIQYQAPKPGGTPAAGAPTAPAAKDRS